MDQVTHQAVKWPHIRRLDTDTVLVVDQIGASSEALAGRERVHAHEMTPGRLREFAAGRAAARRGLADLNTRCDGGIPIGEGGEPIWPAGTSGSISHIATHAVAIVARSARHASVGVDLDDCRLIGSAAAADLMTSQEIEAVLSQGWTNNYAIAQNIVFLAKEAVFKYQYPLIGRRELEFAEVRISGPVRNDCLSAAPIAADESLDAVLVRARIFYQEIHGLRICWVLSMS